MIEVLVKKFDQIEKDVNVLTSALSLLMLLILLRAAYFLYAKDFESIWNLLGPLTPVTAGLLVSRIASRAIVHGQVQREDDRRREIVRVTHHLLAVTKDLKSRIGYFRKLMEEGDKPISLICSLAKSIEKRYETLFEREVYQLLPGKSIDLINNLSGSIYGILAKAEVLGAASVSNSQVSIRELAGITAASYAEKVSELQDEIQLLIDQIYDVRMALDIRNDEKP